MRFQVYLLAVFVLYEVLPSHGLSLPPASVALRSAPQLNVSGLVAAVFSALNADFSINLKVIPEYAKHLKAKGINSILVGGASGEHTSISPADRKAIINEWVKEARSVGIQHIMVQLGAEDLNSVLDLTRDAASKKVDSILIMPPSYFKPKDVKEVVQYISTVAKEAPNLPILYYHVPRKENEDIDVSELVKAASEAIPNFKGMKATTRDIEEILEVKRAMREDQKVFMGGSSLIASAIPMGIDSIISPAANVFPELMQKLIDSAKKGDNDKAKELQNKLSATMKDISKNGGRVAALKEAFVQLYGIDMGPHISRIPLTNDQKANIKKILADNKALL